MSERERERRETETETEREKERERETDRQTDRQTDRGGREGGREGGRKRERERERARVCQHSRASQFYFLLYLLYNCTNNFCTRSKCSVSLSATVAVLQNSLLALFTLLMVQNTFAPGGSFTYVYLLKTLYLYFLYLLY